ncbi:hypothetical protein [Shimazuella kribbensis]|uniref:hypothetical protein n=1 Tax=Shimazuella kribbensis TaxID=139808 RepID=UPI000400C15A|nr:hypothetical protein [Shimazuella kribbensis]
MNWQDIALIVAAVIGIGIAVIHGMIIQRRMVRPFEEYFRSDERIEVLIRRLVPLMLHYSTICWILGGFALIVAIWFEQGARFATGLFVGCLYLSGAIIALWATRGRHFAGILYVIAVILIGLGINISG